MDVLRKKEKNHSIYYKIGILVVFVIMFYVLNWTSDDSLSVAKSELLFGTVQYGDLEIVVGGFGELQSSKLQVITSGTNATVKEIILKPGDAAAEDSIIMRLEDPNLERELERSQQELSRRKANYRQTALYQKREMLAEQVKLIEMETRLETEKLKTIAAQELVEEGIVSRLDYKQSILQRDQLKKIIEINKQRMTQLIEVNKEALMIAQEQVNQQQSIVDANQELHDRLNVKAGLAGVIQSVSVSLGQSLNAGQELATVGSTKELNAILKIPQSQAKNLNLSAATIIDTRQDTIKGQVTRISPLVENNTISVEVTLETPLPESARPQLRVEGDIMINKLSDVYYIDKPAGARPNSIHRLYTIPENGDIAKMEEVRLGEDAGRYIQILSKVKEGQRFIISELGRDQIQFDTLRLLQ